MLFSLLIFSVLMCCEGFTPLSLTCPHRQLSRTSLASTENDSPESLPPPPQAPTPTSTTDDYKYISAQGFEVVRPVTPSAAAINSLPRRLLITTVFLTIPLSLASNFLGLTSKLIISSPIHAVSSLASSLNLQELFPDSSGYKIYKSPPRSSQPLPKPRTFVRYSLLVPPNFVQDSAILLARSQLTDPNREMKMSRSGTSNLIPDVAWGPMGKIDPVTRKSSSDTNISVIKNVIGEPS